MKTPTGASRHRLEHRLGHRLGHRLRYGLVAAVLIAGCYGAKDASQPAASPPPATEPRREDPTACVAEAGKLAEWLKLLASEGYQTVSLSSETKLAVLAGAPPSQVPEAAGIHVTRSSVVFRGEAVSPLPPRLALGALTTKLRGIMASAPATPVLLAIDESTPWSVVAAVVQAAERGGVASLALLLQPGTSKVTPPEPEPGPEPGPGENRRKPYLFTRCDAAGALMDRLGHEDDKTRMLVDELPRAIEACACRVELPALRRWLWSLWQRDQPEMPMTTVALAIAAGGVPLTMAPSTPWSVAHVAVVAAARDGRPVSLK